MAERTGDDGGAVGGRTGDDAWAAWGPPTPPARTTPTAPEPVDLGRPGYTDLVEVARGGDSVVYRARQTSARRDVAIKVIDVADPATLARFERELEITVTLGRQHPHVVTVLDTFTTPDGQACLVMEFHDLGSLHDRLLAHGALPVSEVVAAGTAVADALAFAHSRGVVHRDVKPQNVLVLPTSYVLTDFGIARHLDSGRTASLERFSYRHASPQVLDGLEPTVADDVWSLGSTLSTLLDGRAPFASVDPDDDTALAYLRRVRTGERRALSSTGAPVELVEVVERCLRPDPAERFATAAEVRDALALVRTESRAWAPGAAGDAPATTPTGATSAMGAAPAAEPTTPSAAPPATAAATLASAEPVAAPTPPASASVTAPARAPSALAGAAWAPPTPDADADGAPTGAAHAPPAVDEPAEATTEASPETGRRRWPAIVGFVAGAVLLGSGIGAAAVLFGGDRSAPPPVTPDATALPVPTLDDDAVLPDDDPLDVDLSDPAYAPGDVAVVDNGTSLTVSWTDPTDGGIAVAVVDATDPENPVALESIVPGVTTRTIEGVDPDAASVCLLLVGIDVTDTERWGSSEVTCVDR